MRGTPSKFRCVSIRLKMVLKTPMACVFWPEDWVQNLRLFWFVASFIMGELCSKVYFYFVNPSQHKRVRRFWDWWNISLRLQFCLLVCLVSKSPRISLTHMHAKLTWTTKQNNLVDLCRVGSFVILFFYHPLFYGLWPMTHSEQSRVMTTRIYTKILVLLLGCPKFWHYFWVDSTDLL